MQRLLSKFILILIALLPLSLKGQHAHDLQLIKETNFISTEYNERKVEFYTNGMSGIKKLNPLVYVFGGMLYVYQKYVSVQISSRCSYHPTCSGFSKDALKTYGLLKGVALSADRLMRCNQIAARDISVTDMDFKKEKIRDGVEKYKIRKN